MPIEKCPDKNAYLEIMVKSTIINVASGSDAMSSISGFDGMSMESGPDSEFNFGDMKSQMKERNEENAKDIDDIGDIGIGDGPKARQSSDPQKQSSSYRKRLL